MELTTAINSLGTDYVSKVTDIMQQSANSAQSTGLSDETFDSIFNSISGILNDTNSYIQTAQQAEIDFALGNLTNAHELGIYQQQANLALQYTVAIRDKVLDAYKEIMNMSI